MFSFPCIVIPWYLKGVGSRNPHRYQNKHYSRWLYKTEQCLHIIYTNLPHNLNHLSIIYNTRYFINIILNVVILYCLGNNNEKKGCTCSVQTIKKKLSNKVWLNPGIRKETEPGPSKVIQRVKVLAANPGTWVSSSDPLPSLVEGKSHIQQAVLWPPHACCDTHPHTEIEK